MQSIIKDRKQEVLYQKKQLFLGVVILLSIWGLLYFIKSMLDSSPHDMSTDTAIDIDNAVKTISGIMPKVLIVAGVLAFFSLGIVLGRLHELSYFEKIKKSE